MVQEASLRRWDGEQEPQAIKGAARKRMRKGVPGRGNSKREGPAVETDKSLSRTRKMAVEAAVR